MRSVIVKNVLSVTGGQRVYIDFSVAHIASRICQMSLPNTLNSMSVGLSDNSLLCFTSNVKAFTSYAKVINAVLIWYNNWDDQAGTLTKRPSLRLSEDFFGRPDQCKINLFRGLVAKVFLLQMQLDTSYHANTLFSDHPMTGMDGLRRYNSITYRALQTRRQLRNHVENQLS